jgi:hypothetical protein
VSWCSRSSVARVGRRSPPLFGWLAGGGGGANAD